MQRRELVLFCGALAEELRGILRQLPSYAQSDELLAPRLRQLSQFCAFVGFAGGRDVLKDAAGALAEVEAGNKPGIERLAVIPALGNLLNALGRLVTALCKDTPVPALRLLDAARSGFLSACAAQGNEPYPLVLSLEVERNWRPSFGANRRAMISALRDAVAALERVTDSPVGLSTDTCQGHLLTLESTNTFPGARPLIQGALDLVGMLTRPVTDRDAVLYGCLRVSEELNRLLAFNERARHAHFEFDSLVVAELVNLVAGEQGDDTRGPGFLAAYAGDLGERAQSAADKEVARRFLQATQGVQESWNLACTSGNFSQVISILTEFEVKAPLLRIHSFTKLVVALAQAARESTGGTVPDTLPVTGAMAILMLAELASRPEDEHEMLEAVESIVYALTECGRQSETTFRIVTPAPFFQRTVSQGLASVGKYAFEKATQAKKTIDEVILEKRAVGDTLGDPAALAEIVGGKVARLLMPVSSALYTLRLGDASAICAEAARSAEDTGTWVDDTTMLPLFQQLVAVVDFSEHLKAGHTIDIGPPKPKLAKAALPVDCRSDTDIALVFAAEASQLLNELGQVHLALSNEGRDATPAEVEVVYRVFHTLKGGARTCGLNRLSSAAEACQLTADRLLANNGQGAAIFIEGVIGFFSQWVRAYAADMAEAIRDSDLQAVCELAHSCAMAPAQPTIDLRDFEHLLGANSTGSSAIRPAALDVDDPFGILGSPEVSPTLTSFLFAPPGTGAIRDFAKEGEKDEAELRIEVSAMDTLEADEPTMDVETLTPSVIEPTASVGVEIIPLADANRHAEREVRYELEPKEPVAPHSEDVTFTFYSTGSDEFGVDSDDTEAQPYLPVDEATVLALVEQFVHARHDAHDDVDRSVLPAMADEVTVRLAEVMDLLGQCRAGKANREVMEGLKRNIHTLKGCTRTAGLMSAGAICHQVEDHMDGWAHWRAGVPFAEAYERAIDQFAEIVDRIREVARAPIASSEQAGNTGTAASAEKPVEKAAGTVRVAVSTLDVLSKSTSEAVILSTRTAEEVQAAWGALRSLDGDLDRMRKLMHELEIEAEIRIQAGRAILGANSGKFDPLELDRFTRLQEITRSLSENLSDMTASKLQIQDAVKRLEDVQIRKAAVADTLQHESSRMMVAPLDSHSARLSRVVRKACQDAGVQAALAIYGDAEAPAAVIERLLPAIEHILRNAVAHGIEDEATRRAAGKEEIGRISISAASSDGEFVLSIQDDGRGIDPEAVLERARFLGLARDDAYADQEIYQFLFANGFSTAGSVTELSGRGVGLDAARNAVKEIGGTVEVSSKVGVGTGFKIVVPSDISTMSVVPVGVGDYRCLIPAALVDRIVSVPAATTVKGSLFVDGIECRYVTLADLVGDVAGWRPQPTKGYLQVIVCGIGSGTPTAIQVDTLEAYRRVVVRPLGTFLGGISGLVAGTIAGDGTPLLIVNPLRMSVKDVTPDIDQAEARLPLVMIADDSSTVRLVTSRFLRKHGYDVVEAKDGLDAIDILRNGVVPDMFLLDIEMPRMDGFELIRAVRRMPDHSETPIVMITSRTAQKHREYAMEIGANAYIGKPYEEKELLSVLQRSETKAKTPA